MAGCDSSRRASSTRWPATARPEVEGAQAAQGEPGLQRPGDGADQVAPAFEDVVQLVVADHERAHHHVAVAGEELGHRVQHDVGAELERPLDEGSGEGVVDDDRGAGLVAGRDEALDVGDLEGGVGRRLDPEEGRVVEGADDRGGVGDVDEQAVTAASLEVAELADAAEVRVPRRHHQCVLADQVQHRGDGCETGREGQRATTLQGAERLLERRPRRVRVPSVLEVATRDVRRRHRDRRVQRLVHSCGGRPACTTTVAGEGRRSVTGHGPNLGG